jgi:hypothetical protein
MWVLGAAAALLLTVTAAADFKSVLIEPYVGAGWVENGYEGLSTFRLYATFDNQNPGEDGVLAVWGSIDWPATFTSHDGLFHNSVMLDRLRAPIDMRPAAWENQWDTYVTIGKDTATGDATMLSPDFEAQTMDLAQDWTSEDVVWFVTADAGQSIAVEHGGERRVLLGQFTVATPLGPDNIFVDGFLNVLLRDGSAWVVEVPCRVPENLNGDAQVGFDDLLLVLSNWGCTGDPCSTSHPFDTLDIDDDGEIGFGDLLRVLAAWTVCDPFPFPVDFCPCCTGPCDADINGDGTVDFADMMQLVGQWGSADPAADINCNGVVEALDLLYLLMAYGTEDCL